MALLNTWASQQNPNSLSPLDRLLNNYIQQGDAPLAYLMRGDAKGLLQDLNTPKPVNMTQDMTNAALNLNPVMGLIGATAYHGSPAIFDKFDIKKLGSGEGNQVYGHGMYFAENPEVAKQYREALTKADLFQGNKPLNVTKLNDIERMAAKSIAGQGYESAIKAAKEMRDVVTDQKWMDDYDVALKKFSKEPPKYVQNKGALYKVDIPDEYMPKMLDWNKPVPNELGDRLTPLSMQQFDTGVSRTSGEGLYKDLMFSFKMAGSKNPAQDASNWLNANGISGIKYLDQGSRSAGGTQNYVVFDPSDVKILERNGILVNK